MTTMTKTLYKSKITSTGTSDKTLKLRISKKIVEQMDIKTGDRFTVKKNVDGTEAYLDRKLEGSYKIGKNGNFYFPYALSMHGYIRDGKTVLLDTDESKDRIILKYLN